ncbi:hypothetical protein P170DRAFT_216437 [Aspergillus steynii IBT 23096]|uniref:Uncharacterized protein n=1 Tax=Aspergillus steynii IBT 23096 TaxID=1392250 RepID=A0A2I2G0R4_9EURO|nr:uncharacterized protein P170DRAFT_216437 [Aspergillus steynii IBT 23096]PLB46461.1 hypothetical protein P170DRAFT_216437 [Aspergillus steynii IBT 23096]
MPAKLVDSYTGHGTFTLCTDSERSFRTPATVYNNGDREHIRSQIAKKYWDLISQVPETLKKTTRTLIIGISTNDLQKTLFMDHWHCIYATVVDY